MKVLIAQLSPAKLGIIGHEKSEMKIWKSDTVEDIISETNVKFKNCFEFYKKEMVHKK